MTLILCVSDYWQRRHYYNRLPIQPAGDTDKSQKKAVRRLLLQLDAITGNYWLRELLQQKVLRDQLQAEHKVQILWLSFHPPERDTIDYKFADMLAHTIWEHIEMEHLMSWLSTLGGGFSALGEQFERCVSAEMSNNRMNTIDGQTMQITGSDSGKDFTAAANDWSPSR